MKIFALSNRATTFEFDDEISPNLSLKLRYLSNEIKSYLNNKNQPGMLDIVIALNSLTIIYDNLLLNRDDVISFVKDLHNELNELKNVDNFLSKHDIKPKYWKIPICYDEEFALDIEHVSQTLNLSIDEIIKYHLKQQYFIYLLGFLPGFAYSGKVIKELQLPRKKTPNLKVPSGSIAIANEFNAIYAIQSPGGWNIIARTPIKTFNINNNPPNLYNACDYIVFERVDKNEYFKIEEQVNDGILTNMDFLKN